MKAQKILFVDRDGTLIEEPPDQQVDRVEKVRLVSGVIAALLRLRNAGYRFVMVTNQDGLGTNSFPIEHFRETQRFVVDLFSSQDIHFDEVLICPHFTDDHCDCRKPATGLVTDYLACGAIDRKASCVVGDRQSDLELARNMGLAGFCLGPDLDWAGIVAQLLSSPRVAQVQRRTRETDIEVRVDLDAAAPVVAIETGIGFFDHMLEQVARHAGFSLSLRCRGDLDVDEHHTVEDTALALGSALREALGEKRGIGRYGFVLPMDEARAQVAIDLAGRPYSVFEGAFTREQVGSLPTEMVPHFFRSLAETLGAALHIQVIGENSHHMIEAAFKGLGRCLRQAIRVEDSVIPSTKGAL